jgi:hypothetical protein
LGSRTRRCLICLRSTLAAPISYSDLVLVTKPDLPHPDSEVSLPCNDVS